MSKDFNQFRVGDEVVVSGMPGVVSFIDSELKTMSILVGRGCHQSEDTKVVVRAWDLSKVSAGWPDREVATAALTPRECSWYSSKRDSNR